MTKARELAELARTISDTSDATAITINSSEEVTFADDIFLADDKQLVLGNSSDFTLKHHNSGYGHVQNTGTLYIDSETIDLRTDNSSISSALSLAANNAATFSGTVTIPTADINGGTADSLVIGASTAAAGTFTSVVATGLTVNTSDQLIVNHSADGGGIRIDSTNDTNTGSLRFGDTADNYIGAVEYNHSTNVLSLYADNATRMSVSSTGIDVTGSVTADGLTVSGDAVFTPDNDGVRITGANYATLRLEESDTTDVNTTLFNSSGDFVITTSNDARSTTVDRFRLDHATGDIGFYNAAGSSQGLFWDASAESLGIGTSSPQEQLHVYTTGNSRVEAESTTGVAAFKATNNSGSYGWYVDNSADAFHLFDFTDSAQRVTVDGDGKMGIGESVPLGKLHVKTADSGASVDQSANELVVESNGNAGISILSGQSYSGNIYFGDAGVNWDGYIAYSQASRKFVFGAAAGTNTLEIDSNGTLIGGSAQISKTTTGNITSGNNRAGAVLKLHHEAQWENGYGGGDFLGGIEFSSGDSSAGEGVRAAIKTSVDSYYNTNKMRFYVAQNANTSLLERLELEDNLIFKGRAGTSPRFELVNFDNEDNDTGRETTMRFNGHRSGGEQIVNAQISGHHSGNADDDQGMMIFWTNTGSGGLVETLRIRSDKSASLNDGHLIMSNGYGIHFGAATSSASGTSIASTVMDDYEEGTCTLTIGASVTNPTISQGNTFTAYYTKVGNKVTVAGYTGSRTIQNVGSGIAKISGLPFNCKASVYAVVNLAHNTMFTSTNTGYIEPNTNAWYPIGSHTTSGVAYPSGAKGFMFTTTYLA